MNRWIHLLGALMLVLMLWTGGTARAAEGYMPIAISAETIGHFAGDKDQVPSDEHQNGMHHHNLCGEQHVAAFSDVPRDSVEPCTSEPGFARSVLDAPSREPDRQLRPPIA